MTGNPKARVRPDTRSLSTLKQALRFPVDVNAEWQSASAYYTEMNSAHVVISVSLLLVMPVIVYTSREKLLIGHYVLR